MGSGVGAHTLGTDANASAQAPTPKGVLEGPAKRLSEAGVRHGYMGAAQATMDY
jgi:hypothetical protein